MKISGYIGALAGLFLFCLSAAVSAQETQSPDADEVDAVVTATEGEALQGEQSAFTVINENLEQDAKSLIEEITVTAQKREQTVQEVAVSITALSEALLEKRNIDEFSDFARIVPSLSFQDQGSSQGQIAIRGVASAPVAGDEPANKESVAIYFGEVPVATSRFNPDLNLFDVKSVTVLRGPQGTLYGAGSLAGTIKIEPNEADATGWAGTVEGTLSNTDHGGLNYKLNTMINAPLVEDVFAVRGVLSTRFDDGFIDNVATGVDHVNDEQITTGRISGKYTPGDRLSVTGSIIYQDSESDGFPSYDLLVGGADIGLTTVQQSRGTNEGILDEFTLYNLVVEYEFDSFQVLSSSSYWDRDITFDIDLTSSVNLALSTGGLGLLYAVIDTTDLEDFVQELRFTSTNDSDWQWITGLYYQQQDRFYRNTLQTFDSLPEGDDIGASFFGSPLFIADQTFDLEQFAVFGELSYQLTDRLKATVGGRWFDVTQDFTIAADGLFNDGMTSNLAVAKEDGFNPKFVLSYQLNDDILLNAQAAKGFRLGGPNDVIPFTPCMAELTALGLTAGPPSYDSESLWNYEVNAKTSWADNRVIFNAAIFHIDYDGIQATRRLNCGFGFTDNAGSATSKGAEVELVANLAEGLDISVGGSFVDAELEDGETLIGQPGDRLPLHPRLSLNATIQYGADVGDWYVYGAFDYSHTGKIISVLDFTTDPTLPQPLGKYDIGGLRFGAEKEDLEVILFVDNIWNEQADLFERSFLGDLQRFKFRNQPRTLGLTVRARY